MRSSPSPASPGTNAPVREGGIFRISLAAGSGIDHLDPALAYTPAAWALLDTVCARLLTYPDKPPPAGFRPVPEVAAALPKRLPRSPYVHVHVAQRLSLQRRHPRPGECLRSRDQPHARPGRCLTGRPAGPRHRRRRRGAGREDARCSGRRRPREHARRPVHAPGVRLRGSDDDAVLLRRAAEAARRSRGSRRVPRRGAVLRRRVQARRARRHPAQPLLRRPAATPCRRIRRRSPGIVAAGDAEPRQAGRGRLGPHRRRHLLRPVPGSRLDVRRQRLAVLRQAGADVEDARVQLVATALSRQSEAATRRQLRPRPAGAPVRRPTLERADRPVPALHTAGLRGREHLPARPPRCGEGARARGGQYPRAARR